MNRWGRPEDSCGFITSVIRASDLVRNLTVDGNSISTRNEVIAGRFGRGEGVAKLAKVVVTESKVGCIGSLPVREVVPANLVSCEKVACSLVV